ncbi:hypothetical protein QBZ16_001167 [Prototheca wickerhamii]|uniref:AAA+ ATPase domain-containing protein n=1 Tax=Prototheca wickerhamii TaxID=3111 RepID=A0AAD9IGK6_PROWI|nr:hypothetical protein QBZ16_001167 [Prototheca wickerhamii]
MHPGKSAPRQDAQPAPQEEVPWDKEWDVPKITRSVDYSTLLRDIRLERVSEIRYFSYSNTDILPGWCAVIYRDSTIARATVEPDDFRLAYAMETHGVKRLRIAAAPAPAEFRPPREWSTLAVKNFIAAFALGAILLIYSGTQYMRMKKGDAEDREKLRKKADEERKNKQRQMLLDRVEDEVIAQFKLGLSPEEIVVRFQLSQAGISKAEEAKQRGAEAAYQAQLMEDLTASDPNAQAEEMLKMKTMRIRKAEDPVRQRQIREAQRKLRGVKLQYSDAETIFFDDVAGIGDAKLELQEVVDFFTKPERFRASGAKVPRGVLLTGPPGTGKTLLARAVAGEAGVAFLSINASEFVEMFVGVGAARVRDLFGTARSMAPAIVFVDEIDSVGRARGGAQGNDERDQTLNQLLTEMDGFGDDEAGDKGARLVVLAASNRPDVLDPALVPCTSGCPDFDGRVAILRVHLDRRRWDAQGVDLKRLAFETRGYSGARLANLVNVAAAVAGRRTSSSEVVAVDNTSSSSPMLDPTLAECITMDDLENALQSERLGPPRSPYSEPAQRRLALAEAATCVLVTLLPALEPVARASIVPHEAYPLGHTVVVSNEQRELTDQLLAVLAPRAAEEAAYGRDGASSVHARRIALARRIANKMVVSNALTDAVGPRLAAQPAGPADEMELFVTRFMPLHVAQSVDDAIHSLMEAAYAECQALVARNMRAIEAVVELLLRRGTVLGDEVRGAVEKWADAGDLARRAAEKADFM